MPAESALRKEIRLSTTNNHISNIHEHDSDVFPDCLHPALEEVKVDEDGQEWVRNWIDPGNISCVLIEFLLQSLYRTVS